MTNAPDGPLEEAGARLRALVARLEERFRDEARDLFLDAASWREVADRTSGHAASSLMRDALANEKKAAELEKQADECQAELDALLAAPVVSGWQPIESAPKDDGQDLILADADGLVGHGFFDRSNLVWRWLDDDLVNQATHWMSLPAAPVVTQEGEEPCP